MNGNYYLREKKKKTYKEARLLQLNSNKAKRKLKWKCILTQKQTIKLVSEWYKHFYSTKSKRIISNEQINFYEKLINKKKTMKVVILAGGLGSRLSEYTKSFTKTYG